MLFLPLLLVSLTPNFANAQDPSVSPCAATDFKCQLKQALDALTDSRKQLATIPPLIEAIKQEREASVKEREAAAREREAMDRTIKLGDKAIAAQQTVIETYEKKLIPAYDALIEKQTKRIDKLEDRVDRANKRTLWGTLGGLLLGIGSRLL
jgi:hypothetical protein